MFCYVACQCWKFQMWIFYILFDVGFSQCLYAFIEHLPGFFGMIAFVRFREVSQCPLRGFIHKAWRKLQVLWNDMNSRQMNLLIFFLVRSLFFNLLHNMLFFEIAVLSKKLRYLVILWVQTIHNVFIPLFWQHFLVFKSIMVGNWEIQYVIGEAC